MNLASPDVPKGKSLLDSNQSAPSIDKQEQDKPNEDKATEAKNNQSPHVASTVTSSSVDTKKPSPKEVAGSHIIEANANKKDKETDDVRSSPKRRKVLKTRIDERGREGIAWLTNFHESHNLYS